MEMWTHTSRLSFLACLGTDRRKKCLCCGCEKVRGVHLSTAGVEAVVDWRTDTGTLRRLLESVSCAGVLGLDLSCCNIRFCTVRKKKSVGNRGLESGRADLEMERG